MLMAQLQTGRVTFRIPHRSGREPFGRSTWPGGGKFCGVCGRFIPKAIDSKSLGKMNAIIVDDETKARSALRNLLKEYCPDVTVVNEADGVVAAFEAVGESSPDLVFLDIQLKDGTGFDFLKELSEVSFQVIFVTAYDQYAIKAFKYSALDYLLKPINSKDLIESVKRARHMNRKEEVAPKLEVLMSNNQTSDKRIVLKTSDSIHIVNIKDIVRCEADSNYTNIYLNQGKKILISKSLKEFDAMLSESGFLRVHSAHLINIDYLERIRKTRTGELFMKDSSIIPVSASRKQSLMKILDGL